MEMAGRQWYYGFMQRHKNLSLRTPEQTSMNRVKAFCKENVNHFFANLDAVLAETPYGPSNIFNMDETGFSTVPSKMGKIVSLKGLKRVGQMTSAERGSMITLAFAVSASGNSLPPFYLFPRKRMMPSFLEYASKETVGYANDSGWMQHADFVNFMKHFIKFSHSSKSNPTLLLLDNHTSHLSVESIDLALENGVTMLSFPPHCSHRLQPLDVSVYKPVKGAYLAQHNAWMRENPGRVLELMHIPMLIKTALLKGATAENIVSGFRATGICPYNPGIFSDTEFISLGVNEENEEAVAVEKLYGEEEQRCIVVDSNELEVAARETVSTTDQSDSAPSTSGMSNASSYSSLISAIGPLKKFTPKTKSNRGRKPHKTTILTSPENRAAAQARQLKKMAVKEKKVAADSKRKRSVSSSPSKRQKSNPAHEDDGDKLCLVCARPLPKKLTRSNCIKCQSCNDYAHRRCLDRPSSCYLCPACDFSDVE